MTPPRPLTVTNRSVALERLAAYAASIRHKISTKAKYIAMDADGSVCTFNPRSLRVGDDRPIFDVNDGQWLGPICQRFNEPLTDDLHWSVSRAPYTLLALAPLRAQWAEDDKRLRVTQAKAKAIAMFDILRGDKPSDAELIDSLFKLALEVA